MGNSVFVSYSHEDNYIYICVITCHNIYSIQLVWKAETET